MNYQVSACFCPAIFLLSFSKVAGGILLDKIVDGIVQNGSFLTLGCFRYVELACSFCWYIAFLIGVIQSTTHCMSTMLINC